MDPDDLRRQVAGRVTRAGGGLRAAPDLQEVRPLHGRRGDLVDHKGHPRVGADVAVLGGAGHVHPGDVDRAQIRVVSEPDRLDLRDAVTADGSQVPVGLAGQEALLGVGKCHG